MLLTGFCNGKRRFGIPVDILFELILDYKQARGVGCKAPIRRLTIPVSVFPARLTDTRKALRQRENRLFFGKEYQDTGYVLTWPNGEPYLTNYLTETFSSFICRNHLPELMLHGLWHTFSTLANDSAATIYNISRSLGHSTIAAIMLSKKRGVDSSLAIHAPKTGGGMYFLRSSYEG